jgi:selenocysteine lyase/cysteine desulfurase
LTGNPAGPAVAGDFGGFEGRAWLNCAHQGPLPLVAVAAAERALADKAAPHRLGQGLYERLTAAGVDVALRRGRLRVSPHLYNTEADIDRAPEVLGGRTAPVGSR